MSGSEQKYPRETLEFLNRQAEPYSFEAGVGGSFNSVSGSIQLVAGTQDYNIYENLKDYNGDLLFSSSLNVYNTKMKIQEVFHMNPQAAYRFFDTTSAVNYLNNEFSFFGNIKTRSDFFKTPLPQFSESSPHPPLYNNANKAHLFSSILLIA